MARILAGLIRTADDFGSHPWCVAANRNNSVSTTGNLRMQTPASGKGIGAGALELTKAAAAVAAEYVAYDLVQPVSTSRPAHAAIGFHFKVNDLSSGSDPIQIFSVDAGSYTASRLDIRIEDTGTDILLTATGRDAQPSSETFNCPYGEWNFVHIQLERTTTGPTTTIWENRVEVNGEAKGTFTWFTTGVNQGLQNIRVGHDGGVGATIANNPIYIANLIVDNDHNTRIPRSAILYDIGYQTSGTPSNWINRGTQPTHAEAMDPTQGNANSMDYDTSVAGFGNALHTTTLDDVAGTLPPGTKINHAYFHVCATTMAGTDTPYGLKLEIGSQTKEKDNLGDANICHQFILDNNGAGWTQTEWNNAQLAIIDAGDDDVGNESIRIQRFAAAIEVSIEANVEDIITQDHDAPGIEATTTIEDAINTRPAPALLEGINTAADPDGLTWNPNTTQWETATKDPFNGIAGEGTNQRPTFTVTDGAPRCIIGYNDGLIREWTRDGTGAWSRDDQLATDFGSVADPAATVRADDATPILLIGNTAGTTKGYKWSGGTWVADANLNPPSVTGDASPEVFTHRGDTITLIGASDGTIKAYKWNPSTPAWDAAPDWERGLPDFGVDARPHHIPIEGKIILVTYNSTGAIQSHRWTGTHWVADATYDTGLPTGVDRGVAALDVPDDYHNIAPSVHAVDVVAEAPIEDTIPVTEDTPVITVEAPIEDELPLQETPSRVTFIDTTTRIAVLSNSVLEPNETKTIYFAIYGPNGLLAPDALPTLTVKNSTPDGPGTDLTVIFTGTVKNIVDDTSTVNGAVYRADVTAPATEGNYLLDVRATALNSPLVEIENLEVRDLPEGGGGGGGEGDGGTGSASSRPQFIKHAGANPPTDDDWDHIEVDRNLQSTEAVQAAAAAALQRTQPKKTITLIDERGHEAFNTSDLYEINNENRGHDGIYQVLTITPQDDGSTQLILGRLPDQLIRELNQLRRRITRGERA